MLHFRISDILTAADWEPFHALLHERKQTVRSLHAWLIGRGYACSTNAVWNYRRAVRNTAIPTANPSLSCGTDAAARKRIANILPRLHGRELAYLAVLAEFIDRASANAMSNRQHPHGGELEHHGRRSARLPGRAVAA